MEDVKVQEAQNEDVPEKHQDLFNLEAALWFQELTIFGDQRVLNTAFEV